MHNIFYKKMYMVPYIFVQGSAGKYQVANEKTQLELDKAHQEIDILREKMERNQGESRRVRTDRNV